MKENKSPWLHNFKYERKPTPMTGSIYTDIVVLGAGIAGVSTCYMLLKSTDKKIVLIEGDLVAHGATGHNAGYVISEFEKPFKEIVKEYGLDMARAGQKEIEDAWDLYKEISEEIGLGEVSCINGYESFSQLPHFIEYLHEEYLKYGQIKSKIYLNEESNWLQDIPENFKANIETISYEKLCNIANIKNDLSKTYIALVINEAAVSNSAVFTEELVKYCLKKYETRFVVYEKTFVNSIRLLQNNNIVLDSLYGVCIADKLVLCTNGFENFDIYGPYGLQIDREFHMQVSGLIGYMIGTFSNTGKDKIQGNIFYGDEYKFEGGLYDSGPYIYCTNRKFKVGGGEGQLFSVGGPEIKLHDRRIYKKDHLVDESIYEKLINFQKDTFSINEDPIFKWHGLMGYTKTGIRIVGQDKRFLDLFYNLGCNGIGIIPSISGAKRISKIINGERLPKSIFDPK